MFAKLLSCVGPTLFLSSILSALNGSPTWAAPESESGATQERARYAIVVEEKTIEDAPWKAVVEALRKKHSATVFHWRPVDFKPLRAKLAAFGPDFVCFVARPEDLALDAKARFQAPDGRSLELPLRGLGAGRCHHELRTENRGLVQELPRRTGIFGSLR